MVLSHILKALGLVGGLPAKKYLALIGYIYMKEIICLIFKFTSMGPNGMVY